MTDLGYDKPLFILPFDHRGSFLATGADADHLAADHKQEVAAAQAELITAKRLVYEGFELAVNSGLSKEYAGILVDEQFGSSILRDARQQGYITACPVEKAGQDEFDFEFGDNFASHIKEFHPTFCKAVLRCNPQTDVRPYQRQILRLRRLCDSLRSDNQSRFMLGVIVPPTQEQLESLRGDRHRYESELRPQLLVETIQLLQDAGVEPDVWIVEGLNSKEDCEKVSKVAKRDGRGKVSCILLGRGEDQQRVSNWLKIAAPVPGFTGFAIGRTVFWDPLAGWHSRQMSWAKAASEIARQFRDYVRIFETAQSSLASGSFG